MMNNIFHQNKKLIAINDGKNIARRGAKLPDSTINGEKSYPLVNIGELIFKTTCMAIYMTKKHKNNRIKIWIFWACRWLLYCIISYCTIWLFRWSTFWNPIFVFYKRLAILSFSSMMGVCRKSLFNMKNLYSKTPMG